MECSQASLLLVVALAGTVCTGNILHHNSDLIPKPIRNRRHVVLDNNKLCKAFGCVNGYCKENELRKYRIVCECFTGYEGKLCDKLKCPYECGKHGKCARNGPILYCKCDEGYYGTKCDSQVKKNTRVSTRIASKAFMKALSGVILSSSSSYSAPSGVKSTWYTRTTSPKRVKFSEFHSHAEIDTSVKPDVCAPGFQCYHGLCDREAMNYSYFRCICKTNYTGLFCEKRCTLSCENGGTCMVYEDGHQYCSCPFDFTGHFCEKEYGQVTSV